LLEVLLVVSIIAILAGIVIIAINPGKNTGDSRNAQRGVDVNTIINAVYQYNIDTGSLPAVGARAGAVAITSTPTEICTASAVACTGLVDLAVLTTTGKYAVFDAQDPRCPTNCNANGTGYNISKDPTNSRLVVTAINIENSKTITITK